MPADPSRPRDSVTSSWIGRRLDPAHTFASGAGTLLSSFLLTVVGLAAAYVLFPRDTGLVAVFLVAISLIPPFDRLLEENRRAIWEESRPAAKANLRLARRIFLIFLGGFLAYGAAVLLLPLDRVPDLLRAQLARYPERHAVRDLRFGAFPEVLDHNLFVAAILFLFSLLYRSGGAALAISWNASVWSVCLAYLSRLSGSGAGTYAKVVLVVFPHMAAELSGYVLVCLGGIFLSRALVKYPVDSPKFRRVALAVLAIALLGVLLVAAAAGLEASLAPRLLRLLL